MTDTDFYPTDTLASPAEIRRSAVRLEAITGVLLGHGDNVGSVLSQLALSFSEVIAPAVAAQIGSNLAALETAVEGTHYGHAVGIKWADDVEAFKTARDELIYRWELAEIDDFGVPAPLTLWPLPPEEERARQDLEHRLSVADARSAALASFVAEGHALWEAFQDKVVDNGRMFRGGPTAENLALLVSTLGWGAMTLWPEIAPPPVSAADGVTDGRTVTDGLDSAVGPQAVVDALADLAAITRRAEAGHELTPAELDYLEAFYATMGVRVTEVPDYLAQTSFEYTTRSPHPGTPWPDEDAPLLVTTHVVGELDPTLVTGLTASAANGLLVLSRNGPGGGGYQRLPSWVREGLQDEEVPYPLPVGPDPEDYESLLALSEFLGHSDVAAGDGLSRELALATQRMVRSVDGFEDFSPDGLSTWGAQVDAAGRSLLDVIGRNDEVSFDLVTGSDMPDDYYPAQFFLDMYTFEWSDGGASAAGITDFIPAYAASADPEEQAMANEAMGALFGILTDPEAFTTLMDGVGNSGDAETSSLGQVNPEISEGLESLMTAYLDDFGLAEGNAGALGELTMEDRGRFTTLVMTDPNALEDLVAAINEHNIATLSGVTDSITVAEYGMQAGRLLGLVDVGAVNVVMDQLGDELEGIAEDDKPSLIESVVDVTLGRLPGIGGAAIEVLGQVAAGGDVENIPWPDLGDAISGDTQRQYQILAGIAQQLSESNRLPTEIDPRLLDASAAFRDFDELDMNADAARAMLEAAIEDALGLEPGDLLQETNAGYEEVAGQLPTSPDVYENVIEG
ncbi:hypothetical protein BH24ACT9_BH24ACT9_16010 [soil metagenome]